ncbi:molybdenum cofactor guanylyltransferase [soil metagenome]
MKCVSEQLSVAILAGGKSTRMGSDKALLPWGAGSLLDYAIRTANQVKSSSETVIVGDRPEYHDRGASVLPDLHPGTGPLGGIATALRGCVGTRVLVLAVDMPLLSIPLLNAMAACHFEGDALVPRSPHSGISGPAGPIVQTLCAIYRRSCLPAFEDRIAAGDLKVAAAFDDLNVVYLEADWMRRFDPELKSFENANTPQDFRQIAGENCIRS